MSLLFCWDLNTEYRRAPEEAFLIRRAPSSLVDELEKAKEDRDRGSGLQKVLAIVSIVLWLALLGLTSFLRARWDRENSGLDLRLLGIVLAVGAAAVVLTALEHLLRRRRSAPESRPQKQADAAERALREYMDIPEDAVKADILSFGHREGEAKPFRSMPLFSEMLLFGQDDALCLFDGSGLYAFPRSGLRGIRVVKVKRWIPVGNWNKEYPPTDGWLIKYGVVGRNGQQATLRFYCALDILTPFGESCSLLFPAYELDAIAGLTGLAEPELL